MRLVVHLLSGALFGLGLVVSDMINPARVLGFLDVAGGAWDPTLGFVMGGALIPMAIAWQAARRLGHPAFGHRFPGPPRKEVDVRLLAGAGLFGAGWGLAGLCPGPALAAFFIGGRPAWLFVAAMLCGMGLMSLSDRWTAPGGQLRS